MRTADHHLEAREAGQHHRAETLSVRRAQTERSGSRGVTKSRYKSVVICDCLNGTCDTRTTPPRTQACMGHLRNLGCISQAPKSPSSTRACETITCGAYIPDFMAWEMTLLGWKILEANCRNRGCRMKETPTGMLRRENSATC